MSRAFVKEPNSDQADTDLPEMPQSPHPNYITEEGLKDIKQQLDYLRHKYDELKDNKDDLSVKNDMKLIKTDINFLEKRVNKAIPVNANEQDFDDIRFGATIDLIDHDDNVYQFTIVGEDEADAPQNRISWVSPLARILIGKRTGDVVLWERPMGDIELEVDKFHYKNY